MPKKTARPVTIPDSHPELVGTSDEIERVARYLLNVPHTEDWPALRWQLRRFVAHQTRIRLEVAAKLYSRGDEDD